MPVIYGLLTLVGLTLVLSFIRTRLIFELSGASLLIFGTTKPGIVFYSLIFLPGTIIHELSHWIVAEVLQVATGQITIFPDLETEGSGVSQRLGSVATARSDPLRGFLIGVAPFLSGLAILAVLGRLFSLGLSGAFVWWQLVLIIYGIVVIDNSMMISESDRRTWPFILTFFAIITFIFIYLRSSLPLTIYDLLSTILDSLNIILGVTAGINLVMIVGLYGLRRLIQKITKRRIV